MRPGIRLQLVLALGALFFLAFLPLFFAVASLTRATLRAEREASSRAMGRVVAAHVGGAYATRHPDELQPLLDAQVNAGLVGLAVYDPGGQRVRSAGSADGTALLPASVRPGEEASWPLTSRHGRALAVLVPSSKGSVLVALRTDDEIGRGGPLVRLVGFYTLLVALALLLFVYFSLTRLVVRPIDALSSSASRVAAGGRLFEMPRAGSSELVALGRSLSEMTARLLANEKDLRAKIDELERTSAELRAAQEHVIRSERLASVGRLAAGLAHEVGNPLAALLGLQDMLLDGGLTPEEERDFLARMRKETERIHRIIRDLLDFARPVPSRPGQTGAPGRVDEVVADVIKLLGPQKQMRDVRLETDLPAGLPPVVLGHEKLEQIIFNLLSNAADALRGQGHVVLRARADADAVVIEVIDDGPGIDPSIAKNLFEPFVTTKDVGEGTGLGLAVCRGLLEHVGGSIEAAPRADGARGARFILRVPAAVA